MAPSEFWAMTPQEWWWLYDAKVAAMPKSEAISQRELDELDEFAKQHGEKFRKALNGRRNN